MAAPRLRLGFALAALVTVTSCNPDPPFRFDSAPGTAERFVLIGLDGANWEILNHVLDAGRAPVLAGLMESGTSAILWSEEPTSTPAIWTTIFTGRGREAHGIYAFTGKDPQTGRVVGVRSSMRKVPAIWDYMNAFGRSVGIAGAHVTWPAEPVKGFMISRRVSTAGLSATTHPEELAAAAGDGDPDAFEAMFVEEGFLPPNRPRYDWMKRFWIDDNVAFDLALETLERSDPEFVFVYFHLPDVAQHNFWPPGKEPREENLVEFEPILRAYEYVDGRLGDLLAQIGTTSTAFMVVSDHGAQGRGHVTLFERRTDKLLEAMGYLSFRSDGDVTEIDDERSLVVPGTETGRMVQFWVNGRNPELEASARRDEVARRCLAALRALRFDGSGRPVFEKVGRSSDDPDVLIARLGVTELDLDDSVTLRGRSFRIQDFYAPLPLGGNHTDRGILIAAGPPFRRGHHLVPEVLRAKRAPGGFGVRDVAPTVLAAMGLPIPDAMDGRVLEEIFEPAFSEGKPFSSEPVEIDWQPFDPEGLDTEAPDLMLEMLRALGYAK